LKQICNNNDTTNICQLNSLIDATSDSKEFSFCGSDINNTTTVIFGLANVWNTISSSFQIYTFLLSLFLWFREWNEKQLGNILINLLPGENSTLKELKEGNTLFSLLFTSTIEPLMFNYCLVVNFSSSKQW